MLRGRHRGACDREPPAAIRGPAVGWPVYAADSGGSRYSPLEEITPANVEDLEIAWEYHTGDLRDDAMRNRNHAFQATPTLLRRSSSAT
jgi:quinoprotein glucose dehydrogenase